MCQRHNRSTTPHAVRDAINQHNIASQRDTLSNKLASSSGYNTHLKMATILKFSMSLLSASMTIG